MKTLIYSHISLQAQRIQVSLTRAFLSMRLILYLFLHCNWRWLMNNLVGLSRLTSGVTLEVRHPKLHIISHWQTDRQRNHALRASLRCWWRSWRRDTLKVTSLNEDFCVFSRPVFFFISSTWVNSLVLIHVTDIISHVISGKLFCIKRNKFRLNVQKLCKEHHLARMLSKSTINISRLSTLALGNGKNINEKLGVCVCVLYIKLMCSIYTVAQWRTQGLKNFTEENWTSILCLGFSSCLYNNSGKTFK